MKNSLLQNFNMIAKTQLGLEKVLADELLKLGAQDVNILNRAAQSSYEDTYAWVFYQLKDYNNALLWIEKAISNGGKGSATIVEHYGDILYRLSKTDAALLQWQKAKELGSKSKLLDKKISEKKIYE